MITNAHEGWLTKLRRCWSFEILSVTGYDIQW